MDLISKIKLSKSITKKNTISGEHFYIGSEGLVFLNVYIPLNSISVVELFRIEDISLIPYLIAMVVGVILCSINIMLGIIVLVVSSFLCFYVFYENQKKMYKILLKLNNGEIYTLVYGDYEFTREVIDKIRKCVAEKGADSNILVNNGKIEYIEDNSVGKICDNIFNGRVGDITAGVTTQHVNEGISKTENRLTGREWDELNQFLVTRIDALGVGSTDYENCEILIGYTRKKQNVETHNFIKKLISENKLKSIFAVGVDLDTRRRIIEILKKV